MTVVQQFRKMRLAGRWFPAFWAAGMH